MGDAYGFTIKSLAKLMDTKANIPRVTLLHFIAEVCTSAWHNHVFMQHIHIIILHEHYIHQYDI